MGNTFNIAKVDSGNILKADIPINSLERVFQIEKLILNGEVFQVLGFDEDVEKITLYTESPEKRSIEKQIYTFQIKRYAKLSENLYTCTGKSLYKPESLKIQLELFANRLKFDDRQEILETMNKPRDIQELIEDFLISVFNREKEEMIEKGYLAPKYSVWKENYLKKNSVESIAKLLISDNKVSKADKEILQTVLV